MPTSSLRDAEAQHLLYQNPEDGYEMTSSGEPSNMNDSSPTGNPNIAAKKVADGEDSDSQEEEFAMGIDDRTTLAIDPVYAAKAKILNDAVRLLLWILVF